MCGSSEMRPTILSRSMMRNWSRRPKGKITILSFQDFINFLGLVGMIAFLEEWCLIFVQAVKSCVVILWVVQHQDVLTAYDCNAPFCCVTFGYWWGNKFTPETKKPKKYLWIHPAPKTTHKIEVDEEIRKQVDELMRQELKNLKMVCTFRVLSLSNI